MKISPQAHPSYHPAPRQLAATEKNLSGHEYVEDELLLKLDSGNGELLEDYDLQLLETFDNSMVRVKLPKGVSVPVGMASLNEDERVDYAEANDIITVELMPDERVEPRPNDGTPDDLDPRLWGLKNTGQDGGVAGADISAEEAWAVTTGDRVNGPLIAVIDTGVDYNHPDLAANVFVNPGEIPGDGIDNDENGVIDDVHGYNAFDDHGDPMDAHSHGSHCSGTLAAVGNNSLGVVGVNWQARILPVKIFDDDGRTTADAIIRGVNYAGRMGADITSNSWGGSRANQAIRDTFAAYPSVTHVAAAGNQGRDTDQEPFYPASYDLPNIISVAASTRADLRASFSNFGKVSVDVAAPGHEILSTVNGGQYAVYSGTSMACPHVAGIAGLIRTVHPEAGPQEIKERLILRSDRGRSLRNVSHSNGRVNAARSVESDEQAPAAPQDFRAWESNSNGVALSWTSSGDDGWCGEVASGVEFRVSNQPITEENFNQAQVFEVPRPLAIGQHQQVYYNLEHSTEERQLHFAMRQLDNVGNRAPLVFASARVPAADMVFAENFDDESHFLAEGDWGLVEEPGRGRVWTDSPNGLYPDDSDYSLTSPPFSLAGKVRSVMVFDAKHDLFWGDEGRIEVSRDGELWKEIGKLQGPENDWQTHRYGLSEFDGDEIQVRIRLKSNNDVRRDGIFLDDFKVLADRTE